MYFQGYIRIQNCRSIAFPFAGVVDQLLEALKKEKSVEIRSAQVGLGKVHTSIPLRVRELRERGKHWNEANTQVLHQYPWNPITNPFDDKAGEGWR